MKVKRGEAAYERDSVLFDEIQNNWPLLAGLFRAANENEGKLCVLDFGGSLGSVFYQNKEFLESLKSIQWCIVEQVNFVDLGKIYFEDERLKFYKTIDECLKKHNPNVLLLSSVIPYLEKPYEWIMKFSNLKIPYIIVDRTPFIEMERDILTIQKVPESIYKASYPAWFFNLNKIEKQFVNYDLLGVFDSFVGGEMVLNNLYKCSWKGLLLKLKTN